MHHHNYSKKDLAIAIALFLAVTVIASLRLTAGFPYWGDDPSAYMNEGIAIAEGRFREQAEINYFYHPSPLPTEAENGSLIYAWGYPLQLALVNRLVGFDRVLYHSVIWYKIPNVICEGFLALTGFLFFRRRFPVLLAAGLSLLFVLDDELLRWVNITEPDLWLMAAGLAAFLLMECYTDLLAESRFAENTRGKKGFRRGTLALVYGVMLWYAHELRLNGITILLACAFGHALFVIREKALREKRSIAWQLLPYAVFAVLTWASERILAPATGNMSDFTRTTPDVFVQHCIGELFAIYYFITDLFGLITNVFVIRGLSGILLLLCGVGLIAALKRELYLVIFMIGSFLVTAMLPYGQGLRYLFNLLPIVMLCLGYGVMSIIKWGDRGTHGKWIHTAGIGFFALLLISSVSEQGRLIGENLENWRMPEGPVYSTQAIEMYRYIQENVPEDSIVAFEKPRALYLNTCRRSFAVGANGHTLDEAEYALFLKSDPNDDTVLRENKELTPIKENDEFILSSISRP